MIVSAPPGMQPWIRETDLHIDKLGNTANGIQQLIDTVPRRDFTVFTDGPAMSWDINVPQTIIDLPNVSVQVTCTTGLLEVTTSATLRASTQSSVGVGFYFDTDSPVLEGDYPQNGTSIGTDSYTTVRTATSYVKTIPVQKGTYRLNMFYVVKTGPDTPVLGNTAVINSSLIARGV